jgi:hypothetical protein
LTKLAYYPRLVLRQSHPFFWLFAAFGLIYMRRDKSPLHLALPLSIAVVAGVVYCIFNLFSMPATAAPGRYALPFVLLMAPYAAYGLFNSFTGQLRGFRGATVTVRLVVVALFAAFLGHAVHKTLQFDSSENDSVAVGRYLHELLEMTDSQVPQTYMLELDYWAFMPIVAVAGHAERMVLDRERVDGPERNTIPSLFLADPSAVRARLSELNSWIVVLKATHLKRRAESLVFLERDRDIGSWTIYRVRLDRADAP